ncbi:hypothetical protein C8J56DRAFT_1136639 [Mycena floridula]|nr:hypothetical protein C8J56DRAFT_1136639 [Mycena floridula]
MSSTNFSSSAPSTSIPRTTNDTKEPPNPLRTLGLLAGLLVPISLVPYMLTRRQVSLLRRKVDELAAINRVAQRQLLLQESLQPATNTGFAITPSLEADHTTGQIESLLQDMGQLRLQVDNMQKAAEDMTAVRTIRSELLHNREQTKAEVQDLQKSMQQLRMQIEQADNLRKAAETELIRTIRVGTREEIDAKLKALQNDVSPEASIRPLRLDLQQTRSQMASMGPILASVAAFMERTEMFTGVPTQADVEPIRSFALSLTRGNGNPRRGQ